MSVDGDPVEHLTYDEPEYGDELGVRVTGRSRGAGARLAVRR